MMPKAYVIFDVNIFDMARYQEYMHLIKPQIEASGGKYLARGGPHKVLEGDWAPDRLVIFEFPSMESVEKFYNSKDYQDHTKAMREECSSAKIVVVEGLGEAP